MNIQQFISILLARYKIAFAVLLVTVTGAFLFTLAMPDKYVASATVMLDVKSDPLIGMAMAGMALPSYVSTQTEIISSQRVAQSVVKLLKFDENPQLREQWRNATQGKGQFVAWMGSVLSGKLEVKPSRDSNIIDISYSSEDPAFAAIAANAFAQAYIDTNLELKVEPARQYAQWFQVKVEALRVELENAQGRLAEFQKKTGLVSAGNSRAQNVESSKIAELSGQLMLTEGQSADLQSRNKYVGSGDTLADVMQNPVIVSLKSEIIRLESKLQEASLNLGKNNPQYLAMESQIAALKQKMADETQHILSSINTANNINKQKKSELKATIESQKQKVIEDLSQRDQIAVLERDVESAQRAYDTVVQRYTESSLQSQSNQTNIIVLTPAIEPTTRSSPKMMKNLLIATFLGTLLGVGAAFVAEMLDQRVRTIDSLESAMGLSVLVQFKKDAKPLGFKKWLKKTVDAMKLKLRLRKAAPVV
jgi:chain length determinant protein EpsF